MGGSDRLYDTSKSRFGSLSHSDSAPVLRGGVLAWGGCPDLQTSWGAWLRWLRDRCSKSDINQGYLLALPVTKVENSSFTRLLVQCALCSRCGVCKTSLKETNGYINHFVIQTCTHTHTHTHTVIL